MKELTTSYLKLTFKDKDGKPVSVPPSSVSYRIDCLTTRSSILPFTPLQPPTGANLEIKITADQNSVLNRSNTSETKRVTVSAVFANGDRITSEHDHKVERVEFAV